MAAKTNRLPISYEVVNEGDFIRVKKVPIFAEHDRDFRRPDGSIKTIKVRRKNLKKMAGAINRRSVQDNYFSAIHPEHHGDGVETANENLAFIANPVVEPALFQGKIKDVLFADFLVDSEEDLEELKKFPYRSVEIHPQTFEIKSLALLKSDAPFHKFPIFQVRGEEKNYLKAFSEEPLKFAESGQPQACAYSDQGGYIVKYSDDFFYESKTDAVERGQSSKITPESLNRLYQDKDQAEEGRLMSSKTSDAIKGLAQDATKKKQDAIHYNLPEDEGQPAGAPTDEDDAKFQAGVDQLVEAAAPKLIEKLRGEITGMLKELMVGMGAGKPADEGSVDNADSMNNADEGEEEDPVAFDGGQSLNYVSRDYFDGVVSGLKNQIKSIQKMSATNSARNEFSDLLRYADSQLGRRVKPANFKATLSEKYRARGKDGVQDYLDGLMLAPEPPADDYSDNSGSLEGEAIDNFEYRDDAEKNAVLKYSADPLQKRRALKAVRDFREMDPAFKAGMTVEDHVEMEVGQSY